jgi:5-hydroxyisourate hydrolase-like protein (transthyretin family)
LDRSLLNKGKITAALATLLLITTIIASLLPQATATPTTITTITPNSGTVGTTVRVTGEIDTLNGSYQIRWDGESVRNGTCEPGTKMVNDTFAVPLSAEGDHSVTLYDVANATESAPETFTVTTSYSVSAEPARRVEGFTTTITVGVYEAEANTTYTLTINVTDPQPIPAVYTATLTISTNATGSGSSSTLYYGNFTAGANTNYVGTYTIAVITVDETLATGNFTVGLTDELEYRITNEVIIRGSGYEKGKFVTANITCVETGETVFSENRNATDGTVSYKWTIPENAMLGIYTVTLSNTTTPGTVKPIPDIQNFTVIEIIVYCQARNKYDKKPLADVSIGVFLKETHVTSGKTNKTGWVDFRLDRGNYTFKGFWKDAQVGILEDQSITGNLTEYVLQKTFNVECELAHITIAINDEAGHPLPFINVTLTYMHPTSLETETIQFETNYTGIIATNTFTNTSYTIETRRYGHLFNTTLIENLTVTRWINITCPTYTLFVHVLDSKELPLQNVQVTVYEWSSWVRVYSRTTDNQGNVNLSATFGRYVVKVYGTVLDREVVLNATVVDLIENRSFEIHCMIFNVDLYVEALDYFGQPIPNVAVKVERKFGQEWVEMDSLPTGLDGFARFDSLHNHSIVGGDCRVSVYVAGKLSGTKHLYLDGSKQILFKIGKYTVIVGHPVETSQLIVYISIGLLAVAFGLALTYRRLLRRFVKKKEKS